MLFLPAMPGLGSGDHGDDVFLAADDDHRIWVIVDAWVLQPGFHGRRLDCYRGGPDGWQTFVEDKTWTLVNDPADLAAYEARLARAKADPYAFCLEEQLEAIA